MPWWAWVLVGIGVAIGGVFTFACFAISGVLAQKERDGGW